MSPAKIKLTFHDPIETKDLKADDIAELMDKVYSTIQSALPEENK